MPSEKDARWPGARLQRALAIAIAGALLGACGGHEGEDWAQSQASLTATEKVPRYGAIRDAARSRGLDNAYLLAGIANTETGLVQCWSEATWACQGPSSPDCGGGPVIAGASDGPCSDRQGGLGMFQFDSGTFDDTLNAYGPGILTVDGQVGAAVDYAVRMVRDSVYTTNAETDDKARIWINAFDVNDATLVDQWIQTVLRYYNGCQPGWSCWSPRYQTYSDGMWSALNDVGGVAFWAEGSGTRCGASPLVVGAIEEKYLALGGCGSILGVPITAEQGAPDGVGRYSVFEKGSIYWTPTTGAHEVHGLIRDRWRDLGWETGPLGYPVSDEYAVPGGSRSDFQFGAIVFDSATGLTKVELDTDGGPAAADGGTGGASSAGGSGGAAPTADTGGATGSAGTGGATSSSGGGATVVAGSTAADGVTETTRPPVASVDARRSAPGCHVAAARDPSGPSLLMAALPLLGLLRRSRRGARRRASEHTTSIFPTATRTARRATDTMESSERTSTLISCRNFARALAALLLASTSSGCATGADLSSGLQPLQDGTGGCGTENPPTLGTGGGQSSVSGTGGATNAVSTGGATAAAATTGGAPATDAGASMGGTSGSTGGATASTGGAAVLTGTGGSPGPLGGDPGPSWKVLTVDYQVQVTTYWCGPASTRIALSARIAPPDQATLAAEIGTTTNGTDWIGQVTSELNSRLGTTRYQTTEMPNDPPTQAQHDQLWNDVVLSIDNNYPIVANIVAPPTNHPPGYPDDRTIYHYLAVIGYNPDTSEVYIADPASFNGNQLYWLSFDQLATLIPPKGYSSYLCPTGMTTGAIDQKYQALGGCKSVVGGAVTAEQSTPDGVGKYNVFENGSIYWTAATGAHEVHGAIRDKWRDLGWESGALGYPTSDEYPVAGGKRNDFQHGSLTWYSANGTVVQQ